MRDMSANDYNGLSLWPTPRLTGTDRLVRLIEAIGDVKRAAIYLRKIHRLRPTRLARARCEGP